MSMEEPTNCSFTIAAGESNTQGVSQGHSRGRPKAGSSRATTVGESNQQQITRLLTDSMVAFRGEMTEFIRDELRSMVQGMNLAGNEDSPRNQPRDNDFSHSSPRPGPSQEPIVGEKVSNIIRNWRVKFSGYDDQMTVDEFVYRVNVLTTNNLNGDFNLLCRHAHGLFDGKALDWYWRYHRHESELDWFSLTRALRDQYRSDSNDFDIMDYIHRRKQETGESFDDFYDSISVLTDRLKNPISDANLCAILLHNLRHEIRHELIHFEISSVAQLRREVKRHEKFIKDVHGHESRKPMKGRINVANMTNAEEVILEDAVPVSEICAVRDNIKCWNCDKTGHSYYDCLDVRRIFCYGCGAKDTYRPSCPKCGVKPQGNGQRDVRRN